MDGAITACRRACLGMLLAAPLLAGAATTVTVKVTVVAPPSCEINGNRPIEVDFGEVMTTEINGSNYRKQVIYTLSCSGQTNSAMKLSIQGNGAAFDSSVLKTDKTGLGIQLQQGSNKLSLNSWLNFNLSNKPSLWAVPVKQSGVSLKGGEFSAAATLKVAYQ